MYVVKFTEDGLADARSLPKNIKNSIKKRIKGVLASGPYGCSQELQDPLRGFRSFHAGGYRIVFKVYDDLKVIAIAGIGKRLPRSESDIYRRLEILASRGQLAEKVLSLLRGFSPPPTPGKKR